MQSRWQMRVQAAYRSECTRRLHGHNSMSNLDMGAGSWCTDPNAQSLHSDLTCDCVCAVTACIHFYGLPVCSSKVDPHTSAGVSARRMSLTTHLNEPLQWEEVLPDLIIDSLWITFV